MNRAQKERNKKSALKKKIFKKKEKKQNRQARPQNKKCKSFAISQYRSLYIHVHSSLRLDDFVRVIIVANPTNKQIKEEKREKNCGHVGHFLLVLSA